MTLSVPTVSIGIPVYNGAKTLRQTLDSILAQTFTDFEVVISDNASTDQTGDICLEYAAADDRIRYSRNTSNLGARANYNRVFALARGEFFRWNSDNDWIAPIYLERCVGVLREDPDAVACYTSMCRVANELNPSRAHRVRPAAVSSDQVKRFHDSLWMPYHPIFGLFRRSALRHTDLIPNCPQPDRITLAQVALIGRFKQVDEVLFFQRRPARRDYWTWLDPGNARASKRAAERVVRELWTSVDRFAENGTPRRIVMKVDAVIYIVLGSVRGKVKQYKRQLRNSIVRYRHRRREDGLTRV